MRRVAVIHNPVSGQDSSKRAKELAKVISVLESAGIDVVTWEIDSPGAGAALARGAVAAGMDTVLACGGDGTMHAVLQGLAGSNTALGVIPFGTANALAMGLGLARDPAEAARQLLLAGTEVVPAGRIHYHNDEGQALSRYFLVAAGVGPDAQLMATMNSGLKRKLGYLLYLIDGFRIWGRGHFPLFTSKLAGGAARTRRTSELLVVRVRSLGGAVGALIPGCSLRDGELRMVGFATQSRWQYLRFVLGTMLGWHSFNREVELLEASNVACEAESAEHADLLAEADGEVLGRLPVRLEVVPAVVRLLTVRGCEI